MKKLLLAIFLCLLTACTLGNTNSPKEIVKEFLNKYKNQDSEVIENLDSIISSEYTGDYKDRYKTLMINQYKNMKYKITDEIVDGDSAVVSAEITVYDYSNALNEADNYLKDHEDEFYKKSSDETSNDTETTGNKTTNKILDNDKFLDYKLGLLEKVKDTKTYNIEFSLTKDNDTWRMDSLSDSDIEKLHGIYNE